MSKAKPYDIVIIIGPNQAKYYEFLKNECESSGLSYCIIGNGEKSVTSKEITSTLKGKIDAGTDIEVLVHGIVTEESQGRGIFKNIHRLELLTQGNPKLTSDFLLTLHGCAPGEVLCPVFSSCGSAQAKNSIPDGMEAVFLSESASKTINAMCVEGIVARIAYLKSHQDKNVHEAIIQSSTLIPEDFVFAKPSSDKPFQLSYEKKPLDLDFATHLTQRENKLRQNVIGDSNTHNQVAPTPNSVQRYKDLSLILALSRAGGRASSPIPAVNELWLDEDIKRVKDYVQRGANVNAQLMDGTTPLTMALGFAIDVHGTRGLEGTKSMDLRLLEYLAEQGANLNSLGDEKKHLCFAAACEQGNILLVKKLIESGMSVNQTFGKGSTPLIKAAIHGQKELVEVLLNYNDINLDAQFNGKTASEWASKKGYAEIEGMIAQKRIREQPVSQSASGVAAEVAVEDFTARINARRQARQERREKRGLLGDQEVGPSNQEDKKENQPVTSKVQPRSEIQERNSPEAIIASKILQNTIEHYCSAKNTPEEGLVVNSSTVFRVKKAFDGVLDRADFSVEAVGERTEDGRQFLVKVHEAGIPKLNAKKALDMDKARES